MRTNPFSIRALVCAALLAIATIAAFSAEATAQIFDRCINVTELNTPYQEKSPSISADALEIFFQSNRPGTAMETIYRALRSDTDEPFGTPVIAIQDAASPDISPNGLVLLFSRDVSDGSEPQADLFYTVRATRESPFGPPAPLTELNTTWKEAAPTTSADALTIFFHSDRPGGAGQTDLWMARRADLMQPFGTPVPVVELNTAFQEWSPQLSMDGLRLYFSSDRPGTQDTDLFVAERLSADSPFTSVRRLSGEVNGEASDKAGDVTADGLQLFFRSTRAGGVGESDIWHAVDTRSGNVARRLRSSSQDVLFVNGSPGSKQRIIEIAIGEPITVRMEVSEAGPDPADYVLYAAPFTGDIPPMSPQPFQIGVMAFPTPLDGTGDPVVLGNTFDQAGASRLGIPEFDLPQAPGDVLFVPRGFPSRGTFVLQGLILDNGSLGAVPLSMTNAIILRVR